MSSSQTNSSTHNNYGHHGPSSHGTATGTDDSDAAVGNSDFGQLQKNAYDPYEYDDVDDETMSPTQTSSPPKQRHRGRPRKVNPDEKDDGRKEKKKGRKKLQSHRKSQSDEDIPYRSMINFQLFSGEILNFYFVGL